MAMRLATEYVKTCLQLTEAEMAMFIQMFTDQQTTLQVKILDNGNQEVVLLDDAGQEIVLSFERNHNVYKCIGSCRIRNKTLVNLMRKAVSTFKGSATVHRIYETYIMIYEYDKGSVIRIVESKNAHEKVIYEYKDPLGQLERLFNKNEVEQEIDQIKAQINSFLDFRNDIHEVVVHDLIDDNLKKLTHRLFVLEA
ncbi:non-ribosomal peptide synthetase module [Paenibacillus agricola]|uniref:Non-ribosomal peptide synthetase module n=1 Tax=Paenibacillus agricola TaxID=2716264 RepID=A0ABX0J388_9BACL|nr:non-ribosomal peptide synthetase module [Paenibacillus agricola]NHN30123.1 non-ribosomal peptide synthetase module [Paenibacillus agricola]